MDEHEIEILMDRGLGFYAVCHDCDWQGQRHLRSAAAEDEARRHTDAAREGRSGPPGL